MSNRGFTLIELMIVIAIVGILSSIAMPAYTDYVRKARMADIVSTMESIKTRSMMHFNERGSWPVDNADLGMEDSQSYADDIRRNLWVRAQDGGGAVFSGVVNSAFGTTGTNWVRMRLTENNGVIQVDCTSDEGRNPTPEALRAYLDC